MSNTNHQRSALTRRRKPPCPEDAPRQCNGNQWRRSGGLCSRPNNGKTINNKVDKQSISKVEANGAQENTTNAYQSGLELLEHTLVEVLLTGLLLLVCVEGIDIGGGLRVSGLDNHVCLCIVDFEDNEVLNLHSVHKRQNAQISLAQNRTHAKRSKPSSWPWGRCKPQWKSRVPECLRSVTARITS